MPKRITINILLTIFFAAVYMDTKGQTVPSVRQKMAAITAYNAERMPEKLFIHTDKWNYNREDTLWFKAYVFDATMAATTKTGLMYIEIADANNSIINRNMVSLSYGMGWGSITLKPERYPEGTYTLRAYTNWMRNFDEHYIFSRQFTVEGALDENWMINSRFELTEKEGVNNVKTNLAFSKDNGNPMFGEQLDLFINAGRRRLYRTKLNTGVNGTLNFDFNLPSKVSANEINIALIKKAKNEKEVTFNVPVIINRDEKTDLQFMPEGGNLVAEINNRIGFKAINEEGKGVNVSGSIYNSANKQVVDFKSIHLGMGTFELTPQPNEKYNARINYNGKELTFALPAAKPTGLVMSIDNTISKDSILITVTPSADIKQAGAMYYLIGQARNIVCYGANVNTGRASIRFSAPRSAFPTGVARFTLLSPLNVPVAERIVYVDHHDQIKLSITPSKTIYANRDSVSLEISATDKDDKPVAGSFSLAVTDDAQAKPDTSGYYDMTTKLLLAYDLKGNIENPGWYFAKGDAQQKAAALDALMLTQGWVSYNWQDGFSAKQKQLTYIPEPEFVIKGKVTNAFNKKLKKTDVILLGLNPTLIMQTQTDEAGAFAFTGITPPDTVKYIIQAKNKNGNAFNVGTEVEEFVPPVFTYSQQRVVPLYVNIDTSRLAAIRTKQMYNIEYAKLTGTQLKEVQIKAKKIVKDSKSLVDPGEADFTINTEDINAIGKATLLDLLKRIPGFTAWDFKIDGKAIFLVIDAMKPNIAGAGYNLKDLLNYTGTDDIKGIEVMTSGNNQIAYKSRYLPPQAKFWLYAFVEITTYGGNGFTRKIPGSYVYQPPAFISQKYFYSPRYAIKKDDPGIDTRVTIFWAPNIITNEKGKALVSFYTADKTATYTVNIQGTDMQGQVGAHQMKMNVKAVNSTITTQ